MIFTVDANILVYAIEPEDERADLARRIMLAAATADCILTNQALGEFLNVIRRKNASVLEGARRMAADWLLLLPILSTATEQLIEASGLAERHRLQFWDSVILTVAGAAGVAVLLTEDMQDGAAINGVRIVNPFNAANAELLAALLTPLPGTA